MPELEDPTCRRCGSPLTDQGLCTDETCWFTDRQQSGGRYCIIRVDFPEDTNDHAATKAADDLVAVAAAYGGASIVEEGVQE